MNIKYFAFLFIILISTAFAVERDIVIIIDTSSSMSNNDPAFYTVQITQIIADLLDNSDNLYVITLARGGCNAAPNPSLILPLRNNPAFKQQLKRRIGYSGNNHFGTPVRTAIHVLNNNPLHAKLLLMLADSGGLGGCNKVLTEALLELRNQGVIIAAVNLGSSAGAFDKNPAFNFAIPALNVEQLLQSVATIYQKFIGVTNVLTGSINSRNNNIYFFLPPLIKKAFLIVAVDGEIQENPILISKLKAKNINFQYAQGETYGKGKHNLRQYKIILIEEPESGDWHFKVPNLIPNAAWMVIQESSLSLRLRSSLDMAAHEKQIIELELYDTITNKRVTDPNAIRGLSLFFRVDGRAYPIYDNGQNGDKKSGDGIFSTAVTFEEKGQRKASIMLNTDSVEKVFNFDINIIDYKGYMDIISPKGKVVGDTIDFVVEVKSKEKILPDYINVLKDNNVVIRLEKNSKNQFIGSWQTKDKNTIQLLLQPVGALIQPKSFIINIENIPWQVQHISNPKLLFQKSTEIQLKINTQAQFMPNKITLFYHQQAVAELTRSSSNIFTGSWRVEALDMLGEINLTIQTDNNALVGDKSISFQVVSHANFIEQTISFDSIQGNAQAESLLDLSQSAIKGRLTAYLESTFTVQGAKLQIQTEKGWQNLPTEVLLQQGDLLQFPLRIKTSSCPNSVNPQDNYLLKITAQNEQQDNFTMDAALEITIQKHSILYCLLIYLILASIILLVLFIIYGIVSPINFSKNIGLIISPEEDINEGFFYRIRDQRGSKSGFYKNACIYLASDYRLIHKATNSIAKITAAQGFLYIQATNAGILKQTLVGDWEDIGNKKVKVRLGVLYKDQAETIFFEFRNN